VEPYAPRVLVVDDEAEMGDLLEYGLEAEGFEVRLACDGASALDFVRSWPPDAILLDVMLPDIDGFSLLPKLRSLTPVPVIFVSARGRLADKIEGVSLGAADYVVKPFDMIDLVGRLRRVIAR
jgi:two-component system, OmpR family, response regulator